MSSQNNHLFRIPPYHYCHVLDHNTNVSRVETGPRTFIRKDHEQVTYGPARMIQIPPQHYVTIENPVARDAQTGELIIDESTSQPKLRFAAKEIRLSQEPFPLFPGEDLKGAIRPLVVVARNQALRLKALCDITPTNDKDEPRFAGDEWLFEGPGTFIPSVNVFHVSTIVASVVKPQQALKLTAIRDCTDRNGKPRVTGEEWLVADPGAYLPGVYEEVVNVLSAHNLTEKRALHLRAKLSFQDKFGKQRRNGEEWLVTNDMAETHIPAVAEDVVGLVDITTLDSRQFAIVCDPADSNTGKNALGDRKLVEGPRSFFLRPGEFLEEGIQDVYVLVEDEGLVLQAREAFKDPVGAVQRNPGDRWMIRGPCEHVPLVETEVIDKRKAIALDKNEGVYVRDLRTGTVRAIVGETYMLNEHEELWEKSLPPEVEMLLDGDASTPTTERNHKPAPLPYAGGGLQSMNVVVNQQRQRRPKQQLSAQQQQQMQAIEQQLPQSRRSAPKYKSNRDRTRVVMYRVPHNAVLQLYDYKSKTPRVVFGPELIQLAPDEQFTVLSLSGGKPKRPNVSRGVLLFVNTQHTGDRILVETSDHCRLSVFYSFNRYFRVADSSKQTEAAKLFSVPDFVGDACKAIASRIRGAVASVPFDEFHKNSAKIIRTSVFGVDERGKVRKEFVFPENNLIITSIDIQSVEPEDAHTRASLQKSVQLAIQITTDAISAQAQQQAARLDQAAHGRLERQRIQDKAEVEKSRCGLLSLEALSAAVRTAGQARAEAQSRAEALEIEGSAKVKQTELEYEALLIEREANLAHRRQQHELEMKYHKEKNELEVGRTRRLAEIESKKFGALVNAIGADTLQAMAQAGPEMQAKLLGSLGIKSTLITDGKSPINLFQTASGMINTQPAQQ